MSRMSLNGAIPNNSSCSGANLAPECDYEKHNSLPTQNTAGNESQDIGATTSAFSIDICGINSPVDTGLPPPHVRRSLSPAKSDSSEEIIVFVGRKSFQSKKQEGANFSNPSEIASNREKAGFPRNLRATTRDDPIEVGMKDTSSLGHHASPEEWIQRVPISGSDRIQGAANCNLLSKSGRSECGKPLRKAITKGKVNKEYVAHIHESSDEFTGTLTLSQNELGRLDIPVRQGDNKPFNSEHQKGNHSKDSDGWDSADLQDFDGQSTSSEALDDLRQVLSRRKRPPGVQYLVVGNGHPINNARWLPMSSMSLPSAAMHIRNFEERAQLERLLNGEAEFDGSFTGDEELVIDWQEDPSGLEDEPDLKDRRIAKMTDEQLTRIFSKQEELGLGSNDLLLFNREDFETGRGAEPQLNCSGARVVTHQPHIRSKGKKRSQYTFHLATPFAEVLDRDPYNGFDVMDHERPSLRKKSKGRRGELTLELSDSELEQSMRMAWENDRAKKRSRKQEREEVRAQGSLGNKHKFRLKDKHSEGMTMTEVKHEIRDFLMSSVER